MAPDVVSTTEPGVAAPDGSADGPSAETLLAMYEKAALIKLADERFRRVLTSGQAAHALYSPRGQEIVAAALGVALRSTDYLVTTYRGLHDHIGKGVPLPELWAEFYGKTTGTCKGKGGPMHITHPASGVMVTTGIVGSGLPIANGLALASKLRGEDRVTACCFGDGATNIGAFHEALNLASVWNLPVVFICQNNRWAEHTSYAKGTSSPTVATRGVAYSVPAETVDGNDPVAMWRAASEAIETARNGAGPTLLEALTFRFMGHNFGDDSSYIPKEEYEAALAADPVPAFRSRLIADGIASEGTLSAMEAQLAEGVEEAATFALSSPDPGPQELARDVFGSQP
jgi:pyruvate dehydrogenase E1 component alpha subunit